MSDNRVRIWFALFVLAVFCVGLTGGILIGRHMGPPIPVGREFGPFGMGRGRGPGGPPPERLLERLTSELQLTAEQRTQIENVLRSRRDRLDALQRDVRDRFEREQQEIRAEIRKILTPEQQEKFDRSMADGPGWRGRGPRDRGGI